MKRSLLDIRDDLEALDALLCECGGDVSDPRVDEAVTAWLAEFDRDLRGKADGYAGLIQSLEARSDFHKEESQRFGKWAKSEAGSASFLRIRLKGVLEQRQIAKLETAHYRISVQNNGGNLPLVIEPGTAIPDQYTLVIPAQRVVDTEKLRLALAAGTVIPGVSLGERSTRLAIR